MCMTKENICRIGNNVSYVFDFDAGLGSQKATVEN
jgi:hypothetical protein